MSLSGTRPLITEAPAIFLSADYIVLGWDELTAFPPTQKQKTGLGADLRRRCEMPLRYSEEEEKPMMIFVDQVESIGKGLFVVQITIGPAEPDRDFPSVRVRLPLREDEIGSLPLREIHECALRKVPDLLQSVSSAIDEETRPSPVG
jgi:hypothetical protein